MTWLQFPSHATLQMPWLSRRRKRTHFHIHTSASYSPIFTLIMLSSARREQYWIFWCTEINIQAQSTNPFLETPFFAMHLGQSESPTSMLDPIIQVIHCLWELVQHETNMRKEGDCMYIMHIKIHWVEGCLDVCQICARRVGSLRTSLPRLSLVNLVGS